MPKWGMFNVSLLHNEHGHPLFISKLKFPYDNYSVDKVWSKIHCSFYFRGITLKLVCSVKQHFYMEFPVIFFMRRG